MVADIQLHERLEAVAALGAGNFTGEELDGIRGAEDIETPLYVSLVTKLSYIRDSIPHIEFVYIMRRTDDPMVLEFVADADSFATDAETDKDGSGIVEADEENSFAGDLYPIDDVPALQGAAFEGVTSDEETTVDQWGELISGYAPIYRNDGTVAGVIGVDMRAEYFSMLSHRTFPPIMLLLLISVALLVSGFVGVVIWRKRVEVYDTLDRERSSLLSLASHQLGAPVVSMKWWLELLRDDEKANKEEAYEAMDTAIVRITGVIQDLRDAESAEMGKLNIKRDTASLCDVIENAEIKTVLSAKQKKQTIDVRCSGEIRVMVDRNLIEGVVAELIDNAISFSPEKSTITVSVRKKGAMATISVKDEGCGIPTADQERIFEKMTRASNAGVHKPDGNGLGLYIAHTIVKAEGGRLWVTSQEGKGSTFHFTLPVVE